MLHIQNYLNNVNVLTKTQALEELEKDFGVKSKIYENFIVLTYSQIDSPKTNPIVLECRGLILDWDWNILRRPFDRFFNYGEANTQNFNFEKSVCLEKVDGSLIPVWWNPFEDKWCFGTKGTAYAESECNSGRVFSELIDECFKNSNKTKEEIARKKFNKNVTYIFELCTPENRVVVPHTDYSLVFLGGRFNDDGEYLNLGGMELVVYDLNAFGVNTRLPKMYNLNEIDSVRNSFNGSGAFFEGYVFWNIKTNERVKVKNPAYVAIHHLRDNGNLNPKRICDLVFANETDEYLQYFPEDAKFFQPWMDAYTNMKETIISQFETLSTKELTQKEYALKVKDYPYSGIMFALRQGKTLEQCFEKMNSEAKVRLLEQFKE
jgi:T4 RnlA family RNA ligase